MKTTRISISKIVGSGVCVSAIDGQRVYAALQPAVASGDRVVISFSGVTRMTTAFLNAAVGQLYGEFSESEIKQRLAPPEDFEPWHLTRLKLVTDRAKSYFKESGRINSLFKESQDEDNAEDL